VTLKTGSLKHTFIVSMKD